jgi:hypothetical protein
MDHRFHQQQGGYYPTKQSHRDEGIATHHIMVDDGLPPYYQEEGSPPPPPPLYGSSRDMYQEPTSPSTQQDLQRKRSSSSKQPVKLSVCVRMRPIINEDFKHATTKRNAPEICVHFKSDGQTIKLIQDQHHFKNYKVDHTFDTSCGQSDVYSTALKPIVKDVIKGYNGTCIVYGQTASGKTYTMFGSENKYGIAHLAVNELFEAVRKFEDEDLVAKVFISFYQIYLENIYDLLGEAGYGFDPRAPGSTAATLGSIGGAGPNWNQQFGSGGGFGPASSLALDIKQQNTLPSLNIREDIEKGIYVENLHYCFAKDCQNAFELISQGLQRRKVNSTAYNVKSSRSHAILQIYCDFEERSNEPPLNGQSEVKYGPENSGSQYQHSGHLIEKKYVVRRRTLTLVDLAGSERVQTFKQSTKKQLQEAAMINKSIAALGNCIYALSNREQQQQHQPFSSTNNIHIPYRDCKLTRLLSESLGGNSKTSIIATISPCLYNYEETSSTLKFASRAKVIRKVVKRTKREEMIVKPKILNYFEPFQDPHAGTDDEQHNVYRDEYSQYPQHEAGDERDIYKRENELNVLHDDPRLQDEFYHDEFKQSFDPQHDHHHSPEDNFMNELSDFDSQSYSSRPSSRHVTPQRARSNSNTRPPRRPTPAGARATGTSGQFSFQPLSHYSGTSSLPSHGSGGNSTFTLRDFLRACTMATKVVDPNASTVEYELPPPSQSSSVLPSPSPIPDSSVTSLTVFTPLTASPLPNNGNHERQRPFNIPSALQIPTNPYEAQLSAQKRTRRPSSATVASEISDTLTVTSTPAQTPKAGYSSIPSKIDDEPFDQNEVMDHRTDNGSPFPFYRNSSTSPMNVRSRRSSSASIDNLSLLPVGEDPQGSIPNRSPVAIIGGKHSPHNPNYSPSDNSVSTIGSVVTSKGSRQRSSKGVQTWSIVPELPTQKYNGSLDDFGNYAHSTKVDQSTEIEHDILFETASAGSVPPSGKEEFAKLMKMPAYDLAVAIFTLRDKVFQHIMNY